MMLLGLLLQCPIFGIDTCAVAYYKKYEQTGNIQDLQVAIVNADATVVATPKDHSAKAGRLRNLGVMLRSRYK